MNVEYIIEKLTNNTVTVVEQKCIFEGDIKYKVGKPHIKAYRNDTDGRAEIVNELPLSQQNAIFAVWGDTPTVTEEIE